MMCGVVGDEVVVDDQVVVVVVGVACVCVPGLCSVSSMKQPPSSSPATRTNTITANVNAPPDIPHYPYPRISFPHRQTSHTHKP